MDKRKLVPNSRKRGHADTPTDHDASGSVKRDENDVAVLKKGRREQASYRVLVRIKIRESIKMIGHRRGRRYSLNGRLSPG